MKGYLLDTNVLAELMKAKPNARVLAWVNAQAVSSLFTTSICEAEVHYGIERLPERKRKLALHQASVEVFGIHFFTRVLSFDSAAAQHYAALRAQRDALGLPMTLHDAEIAAIAMSHELVLCTRNTADFQSLNLSLFNPWATV